MNNIRKVNVAILDDHQSVIDGYLYRLRDAFEIQVVGTASYGNDLEEMLEKNDVQVLLLDVNVPLDADKTNLTPILYLIPKLLQTYPDLAILPISMHMDRTLIKALVDAGASGYILKEDHKSIRQLDKVILNVASGGVYFSKQAHRLLMEVSGEKPILTPRQTEILNIFAAYPRHTSAAVALELGIAQSTVRNLLSNIYERLNVANRAEAIARARELGLIPPASPTTKVDDLQE